MSKVLTTRMSSGGVYVSPSVKTIKLNSEGVVCISMTLLYDRADALYDPLNDLGEI